MSIVGSRSQGGGQAQCEGLEALHRRCLCAHEWEKVSREISVGGVGTLPRSAIREKLVLRGKWGG